MIDAEYRYELPDPKHRTLEALVSSQIRDRVYRLGLEVLIIQVNSDDIGATLITRLFVGKSWRRRDRDSNF